MSRYLKLNFLVLRTFSSKINKFTESESSNGLKKCIKEGKAEILLTDDAFYNPVQEFNRDLSVAVIKEFIKDFFPKNVKNVPFTNTNIADDIQHKPDIQGQINILEALAATGLRAIRYAKEIPRIGSVIANDNAESALKNIKENIKYNNIDHLVIPNCEDASLLMYKHRTFQTQFHVVDLDPYGSPSSFLDAAVQCISNGGLLMVTCTDMPTLCGIQRKACHARYGSLSFRIASCHEMALRIILRSIELQANRYGYHIIPLLSVSADFYIRVFVKVCKSRFNAKESVEKLAIVYKCIDCETFYLQHLMEDINNNISVLEFPPKLCDHCGGKFQMGGPIWIGNLHEKSFINNLLKTVKNEANNYNTAKRMIGILTVISEELENCPLYYHLPKLFSVVHASQPPSMVKFRSALLNAGYKVSFSHACKDSLKTNAPSSIIWDIVRSWVKLHPIKRDLIGTPGGIILEKSINTTINFESHPEAEPVSRSQKLVRFQVNPTSHWGPKAKVKQKTI